VAPLEEAVTVQGKLEPIDKVKDVQVPLAGVVKQAFVKDGDKVVAGQKLLSLESSVSEATVGSLQKNLESLTAETRFYHSLLDRGIGTVTPQALAQLNVRPEILALTTSRSAVIAENQLYRTELNGTSNAALNPEQQQRLQSSRAELASRSVLVDWKSVRLTIKCVRIAANVSILANCSPTIKQSLPTSKPKPSLKDPKSPLKSLKTAPVINLPSHY
jgi:multidrug efflux pump subunit AcrA (membrane-fusion protein)